MDIVITKAGLQSLVNAEQTGTASVVISQIAFGSGQYSATDTQISLQNEIKRLPVISGGTDDDHSIHVAVQDNSSDSYSVYEFGIFLEDGTLFAVYSQTGNPVLQKTISSVAQFECGITFEDVNVQSVSFGQVAFSYPYASDSKPGIVEIASVAEAQEGTDDSRAITPATLRLVTATEKRKGVVSLATIDEAKSGTDSSKAVTPEGVKEAIQNTAATDSRKGVVELATVAETQAGTDSQRAITPYTLSRATATDSRKGVVELATADETQTGTKSDVAVTPSSLKSLTATKTRNGLARFSTAAEALEGSEDMSAMTPYMVKVVLASKFNGVSIDSEGRVNNIPGGVEPFSLYPSGRSVEMTARAGVCQKTLARFTDNTAGAAFVFFKSRSSSIRESVAVSPGDAVGQVEFIADNGKIDYDGSVQGARVAVIKTEIHDSSTITPAGTTNQSLKGIVRIVVMDDGTDMGGSGVNITSDSFYPSKNNALNCGTASLRWKAVYATNGTIQTSDENLKDEIGEIPEAVFKAWEKVKFVRYKFKDSVREKGDKARFHVGLVAQRIVSAFSSEGLDAFEYGIVCRDIDDNGSEILSLRYDECLALECAFERRRFEEILNKLKDGER